MTGSRDARSINREIDFLGEKGGQSPGTILSHHITHLCPRTGQGLPGTAGWGVAISRGVGQDSPRVVVRVGRGLLGFEGANWSSPCPEDRASCRWKSDCPWQLAQSMAPDDLLPELRLQPALPLPASAGPGVAPVSGGHVGRRERPQVLPHLPLGRWRHLDRPKETHTAQPRRAPGLGWAPQRQRGQK